MGAGYDNVIAHASRELADAVFSTEADLLERADSLDVTVLELVRRVGRCVCSRLFGALADKVVAEAKAEGFTPQDRKRVKLRSILGVIEVPSPYMRNPRSGETARPVKARLGIRGGSKTTAVERALADFGAEESFALAAQRFEEHYGQEVGRTSVLRVVESVAEEAEQFIDERLDDVREAFQLPLAERPGADRVLVELDGSMVRTGSLAADPEGGTTEVRGLPKRRRDEAWRELRVGFARQLDTVERTYVARMDSYEEVVSDLFSAAVDAGLSERTEVYAVADGGHGLRDELDAQFGGLRFLLDRPHLKSHLFETAEAIGLDEDSRPSWVRDVLLLIDEGHVAEVVDRLESFTGKGEDRVHRLAGYIKRFSDALDYRSAHDKGVPLGSGEVESAHRYIPQKRLKLPGACWSPDTINSMLALRVLRANGWWEDFWQHRQAA